MEESFNLVAHRRVNYYTPGSPVQVVRVELLQGSVSKDNAVCLSFKNIRDEALTGLKIRFSCKNASGDLLHEGDFTYTDLNEKKGQVFGMDDAVFVTPDEVTGVEVELLSARYGRKEEDLTGYTRTLLPGAKRLPDEVAQRLQQQTDRKGMKYMPEVLENGWYCACGAFHPNEEQEVYCGECGADRILLQNAINSIVGTEPAADEAPADGEDPTQIMERKPKAAAAAEEDGHTRIMEKPAPARRAYAGAAPLKEEPAEDDTVAYGTKPAEDATVAYKAAPAEDATVAYGTSSAGKAAPAEDATAAYGVKSVQPAQPEIDPRDELAEKLIRWVPVGTAAACAVIAITGFVFCQFL